MDHLPERDVESRTRHFSLTYFFRLMKEGHLIQFNETYHLIKSNCCRLTSETNKNKQTNENIQRPKLDGVDTSGSVLSGIKILARMCAVDGLWMAATILDVQPGIKLSPRFVVTNYVLVIIFILTSISTSYVVFELAIRNFLPDLNQRLAYLITVLTGTCVIGFSLHGLNSLRCLIRKREFIHDFLLYTCSNITLPMKFIHQSLVRAHIVAWVLNFLAEPLFTLLTLLETFRQPSYLPNLSASMFLIVKSLLCTWTMAGAALLLTSGQVIPNMTMFMICAIEKYTEDTLKKHLSRIHRSQWTGRTEAANLVQMLGHRSRAILDEFSVDTLCMDWPNPTTATTTTKTTTTMASQPGATQTASKSDDSSPTSTSNTRTYGRLDQHSLSRSMKCMKLHSNATYGSHIFLYRNLIRVLVELREVIKKYERVFGSYHLALILLHGMTVANWIVIGYLQQEMPVVRTNRDDDDDSFLTRDHYVFGLRVTPFFWRALLVFVVQLIENTINFIRSDCLSERMLKLRCQLFKINIELVRINSNQQSNQHQVDHSYALLKETQMTWSLYDQLDRLSRQINFRLVGDTYYSKLCITTIIAREISFTLFYIQVIAVYANV